MTARLALFIGGCCHGQMRWVQAHAGRLPWWFNIHKPMDLQFSVSTVESTSIPPPEIEDYRLTWLVRPGPEYQADPKYWPAYFVPRLVPAGAAMSEATREMLADATHQAYESRYRDLLLDWQTYGWFERRLEY